MSSSARARRARARAGQPIPVPTPTTPRPPQRHQPPAAPPPVVPQVAQTNIAMYSNDVQFLNMLQQIGVTQAGIAQLQADNFTSMQVLVDQYKGDVDEFATYLKTINKSGTNVRYSPVVCNRLIAVLRYFIQAVTCFHIVPDISMIDRDMATNLVDPYNTYRKLRNEDAEDEIIIDLPELKGHDNWIQFRDKFMSNLSNIIGSNGTPLSYVVDRTARTPTARTHPYMERPTVDLDSWETYKEEMIHFGTHFKRDNAKVWQLLKKSLLGSQPYHHIDQCARQENGRRAWEALRSYYEGQDYVNKTIQECLTKVRTMYYRGETPRFNFEKFIDKQKECYKRLRDVGYNNGMGLDDASKCSNFKQMILPEAQLETALSMARTQGLFNGSFDNLIHFLKAEVDELSLRRSQLRANRSQRVSSVTTSRPGNPRGNRARGARGRGRGNTRGNRGKNIS